MFGHYLKLSTLRRSRYISWNTLFLWGFGLWIALCTSNMYHSDIFLQKATLFYQQNWNSGNAYNIVTETGTMENALHITGTNCTLCSVMLMLKAMLKHIYILVFMCFMMFFVHMHEQIRKCIKIWNNVARNSTNTYLKTIARNHTEDYIFDRAMNKSDHCTFLSELIANYEINAEHLQTKCSCEVKEEDSILERNTVQNEIVLSSYTLLLFSSYDLYRYFCNQQLKNTCYLLTKYSEAENLEYMRNGLMSSNNYRKTSNLQLKKGIQKRIISSSPEFQKFLENLKKSWFLYPCTLEMSTNYVIRIKSKYK